MSAPIWHRLWDKQDHELRIWLGVYCFAMAGALTSAFDVSMRTRDDGPNYEPLWLTAWPLWSASWFAVVAFWIAAYFALIVLTIALPVLGLLYLPYRFQAKGIRSGDSPRSTIWRSSTLGRLARPRRDVPALPGHKVAAVRSLSARNLNACRSWASVSPTRAAVPSTARANLRASGAYRSSAYWPPGVGGNQQADRSLLLHL